MEEMSLIDKIVETKRIFDAHMASAQIAAKIASLELLQMEREDKIRKRFARMYVYKLQKTIKMCGEDHVNS